MKEIRGSLKKFDLDGFCATILDFLRLQMTGGIDSNSAQAIEDLKTNWTETAGNCDVDLFRDMLESNPNAALLLEEYDPSSSITWLEEPGRCPNNGDRHGWDFKAKLLEGKVFLFFPFAVSDMEGSFECADGSTYSDRSGESESDDEDEEHLFGDDVIGFLVRLEKRSISIRAAICAIAGCLPPPTVNLLKDCGFLEQPMIDFVNRFKK